jgi:hypothetical protein
MPHWKIYAHCLCNSVPVLQLSEGAHVPLADHTRPAFCDLLKAASVLSRLPEEVLLLALEDSMAVGRLTILTPRWKALCDTSGQLRRILSCAG